MKNVLSREELLKAKNFKCEDWTKPIQEILDSTNENEILVQDKYLDLIKKDAAWGQILFCKSLNLDLKWNVPQEAKEFVLEKIKACEVVKYDEFSTFYKENGKTLFILNSENKFFYFDKHEICKVLDYEYSLKYNEIRYIVNTVLEEHLKIEGYTPFRTF